MPLTLVWQSCPVIPSPHLAGSTLWVSGDLPGFRLFACLQYMSMSSSIFIQRSLQAAQGCGYLGHSLAECLRDVANTGKVKAKALCPLWPQVSRPGGR